MKLAHLFVGDQNKREIRRFEKTVAVINKLEPQFEQLSDEALRAKTAEFKERFAAGITKHTEEIATLETDPDEQFRKRQRQKIEQSILSNLLPEAFAIVREAGKRVLGMRHFDVQLMGGMALHAGKIAEMRTGEGKTLVATLPAYLNALAGHGVHIVTVNDYLAKRDAHWMGALYAALGMTVGAIGHEQSWLFIRDTQTVSRKTDDQQDDSQSTIHSSQDSDWPNFTPVTRQEAYAADITYGTNNEFGFDYLRDNMAQQPNQIVQKEQWYAIIDEVDSILIDEARTPLIISAPAEESGSLYQTFAQVTKRLIPETDYTVDEKFRSVTLTDAGIKQVEDWIGVANLYASDHVQLVHHLDEALKAQTLFQRNKEYVVREGEVVIVDEFTGRLMPGRRYSEGLHQAIEAKEGVEIKRESNTLATISFQNLFRLYAKLSGMTGTAATEAEEFWKIYQIEVVTIPTHRPMVRIDHQDLIYKNEAAKFAAVITEIKQRHERGQPILIGTISIEKNEAFSKSLKQAGIKHQVLNAKQHEKEAKIIANAGKVGAVTLATNMAGRGVDILLGGEPPKTEIRDQRSEIRLKEEFENWETEHQRVLEFGGLCVIGTERHEARRIDNQLRGRAGRQGDSGESQFYVSMDDDLMRIFGGDRMKSLMDRLGLPDDQPIQAKMISGALESAQRRVEGHNFDIRKHLVEYDDVMNKHREYIYKIRRRILFSDQQIAINGQGQVSIADEALNLMTEKERTAYLEKIASWNENLRQHLPRLVWLRTIDSYWVEHLNAMEALRAGIGLRGYGQHDPLVAYRQEGYQLFERLKRGIEQEVVRVLLSLQVQETADQRLENKNQEKLPKNLQLRGADYSRSAGFGDETSAQMEQEAARRGQRTEDREQKIGRNDPCHCGSGKKFKKCHGV